MEDRSAILKQDIGTLGISRPLEQMFEMNHLLSLKELLDMPMDEWFGFTGFSQHLLNELMNFLDRYSLLQLIKE